MSFNHGLSPSEVLSHRELIDTFGVSTSGGMRKSNRNNLLVLISDHTSLYNDRWIDDTLFYTGMGQVGDQGLNSAQNKTLNHSNSTDVTVYLFEVFQPNNYIYRGEVFLANEPFQETQPDRDGNERLVWIFPLKLKEGNPIPIVHAEEMESIDEAKERLVKRISNKVLEDKAKYAPQQPGTRNTMTKTYERNAYVSELAKRRAKGNCQLCEQPAPFIKPNGAPFLETHHIEWLANGGTDSIDNTVALCANCHRKMHSLNLEEDVRKLKMKVKVERR
ncbi:HNH endonuclease [Rossellomorea sp. NPDC077527]|uniref:HNH endonuclease n=1 Tax=Rossellomorea sp. NPDC077527 TaxID=3364510 RepID=UPI0037C7B533